MKVKPVSGIVVFVLLPFDYFCGPGTLTVEAGGYETFTAMKAGEWKPRQCTAHPCRPGRSTEGASAEACCRG